MTDDNQAFSPASLIDFESCPAMWRHKRWHKEQAGYYAGIGIACHRAISAVTMSTLMDDHRDPTDVSRESLLATTEALSLSAAQYAEALGIMDPITSGSGHINIVPWPQWTVYVDQPLSLDEHFEDCKQDVPVAYQMTVHRISISDERGVAEISDYRSTLSWSSGEDLEHDPEAQALTLATLAAIPDADEVTFRAVMLRHGYVASHTFKRGGRWEGAIKDRLRISRDAILADKSHIERMGSHCGYCPRRHACSTLNEAVRLGGAMAERTIDEIARASRALSKIADEFDGMARAHAQVHGPIQLSETTLLGFRERKKAVLAVTEDEALAKLRLLGMTKELEDELFRVHGDRVVGAARAAIDKMADAKVIKPKDKKLILSEMLAPGATSAMFAEYHNDR